jgi:hypothetical protein
MKYLSILLSTFFFWGCSSNPTNQNRTTSSESSSPHFVACPNDPQKLALRSKELQDIVKSDQADRQIPPEKIDWDKVGAADEVRAKRVAEIFAEGCFKTAEDYAAAALVFQHGPVPDHYYLAYLWSKKAYDLGMKDQSQLMADAIDRYLISLGQRQLFGAQRFRNIVPNCRCLGETEIKFSDKLRVKYTGKSLADRILDLHEANKDNPACNNILYCPTNLMPPAKGTFPGIW